MLRILYRVDIFFKNLFLIIINRVINLIVEVKAKVKVLLLSVSNNFDDFSTNIREINTLRIKDYVLIEILFQFYILYISKYGMWNTLLGSLSVARSYIQKCQAINRLAPGKYRDSFERRVATVKRLGIFDIYKQY